MVATGGVRSWNSITLKQAGRTVWAQIVIAVLGAVLATAANADVFDLTVTDVTTRAFSLVWVSDQPVLGAAVRVYADESGTTEITSDLVSEVVSESFPPAHEQGVVKVTLTGLSADTRVYVQTETSDAFGTVLFPASPPFEEVHTAVRTTKAGALDQPITNDLISYNVLDPDRVTPAPGSLIIVDAPGVSGSPLSAFAGEGGFTSPAAVVDLNNMFGTDGISAEIMADQVLTITEFRGLLCEGLENHRLLLFRRAPAHDESPPITELETPDRCFFADTVCDDTVNILDAQFVLNAFGSTLGECAFNPTVDVVEDGVINVLDVQSVLNHLGLSAPFP